MTTRPTDEDITNIIHWLDAKYKRHGEDEDKEGADLLRAWLAERQAARDGVTDEMASKVLLSLPNFARYNHSESEWAEDVSAMRAALQSIAQPVMVPDGMDALKDLAKSIGSNASGSGIDNDKRPSEYKQGLYKAYSHCLEMTRNQITALAETRKAMSAISPQTQQAVNAPFGNADHTPPVEGVQFLHINNMEPQTAVTDGFQWMDGIPDHPWDKEWFIAELDNGDRVVLKALPDEYTYDFKTADETYLAKRRIKRWMQFPDSEFIAAPAHNGKKEG